MLFKNVTQTKVVELASSVEIHFYATDHSDNEIKFVLVFSLDTIDYQKVTLYEVDSNNSRQLVGNFRDETVYPNNKDLYTFSENPSKNQLSYKSWDNKILVKIAEKFGYINIEYQKNNIEQSISINLADKAKTALEFFYERFLTLLNDLKPTEYLVQYVTNTETKNSVTLAIKPTEILPNIGDFITLDNNENTFVVKNRTILDSNYPKLKASIKLFVTQL